MSNIYPIRNFTVTDDTIRFELGDATICVPFERSGSKVLRSARTEQRQVFELDEDGLGVHWPLLDEDLSIAGLLRAAGRDDLNKSVQRIKSMSCCTQSILHFWDITIWIVPK